MRPSGTWNSGPARAAALLALLGCLTIVPPAQAQQPATARGSAALEGTVVEPRTGGLLEGARVTIAGSGIVATTDSMGHFRLTGLPAGEQELEVRRIGYTPLDIAVTLTDGSTHRVRIELEPLPAILDTVRSRAAVDQDILGYERRKNAHVGVYFDREQIAKMHAFDPTDVLRHVPQMQVKFALGTMSVKTGPGVHPTCDPDLFINGVYQYRTPAGELDHIVPVDQIEHIEVYTDAAFIPNQFIQITPTGAPSCGAIIVWTGLPPQKKPAPLDTSRPR